MARFILGISGASGMVLGYKLLQQLTAAGHTVHLVMSKAACYTAVEELGSNLGNGERWVAALPAESQTHVHVHAHQDFGAPIASGSFLTDGMIIVPCSMATLAAVALGLSDNLLRRAADVVLKERRKLIIVPRETPLSEIHLEHMTRLSRMGVTILPPTPAWYNHPKTLDEIENFFVGRILDALGLANTLYPRWGG